MERLQQQLIGNADVPLDSQVSVLVPRKIRDNILFVRAFGECIFCVLVKQSHLFDAWHCNPSLTFLSAQSIDETHVFPVSVFPETRHVLGIEADFENRRVAVGHFNYPDTDGKLIKIDIYSIDAEYNATLVRVFSTGTECAGSGLLGSFASPNRGEFVALWGDLSNDTFFDTFTVSFKDELEVKIDSTRTDIETCELNFHCLEDVYPGPASSMYDLQVYAVGDAHRDCVAVRMRQVKLSPESQPKLVFHRVVRLSFLLDNIPETHKSNKQSLYVSIVDMVHREDGSSRALVRAMLQETDESQLVTTSITSGASAPTTTTSRTFKHMYLFLLLDLQRNAVLDICTGGVRSVCAIDSTGERMVRFLPKKKIVKNEEEEQIRAENL